MESLFVVMWLCCVAVLTGLHDAPHLVADERARLVEHRVHVAVQLRARVEERLVGLLVHLGDGQPRGQRAPVRVLGGHVRGGLRRERVDLGGLDAVVDALADFLGEQLRVDEVAVELVRELLDAREDFVGVEGLRGPVALDDCIAIMARWKSKHNGIVSGGVLGRSSEIGVGRERASAMSL